MSKMSINIGNSANDGNGEPARSAFNKTNQNFTEVYTALGGSSGIIPPALPIAKGGTGATTINDARANLNLSNTNTTFSAITKNGTSIIVSASTVVTTDSSGFATIAFPVAFPSRCATVVACHGNPTSNILSINDTNWTAQNFVIKTTAVSSTIRVNYVAFGD